MQFQTSPNNLENLITDCLILPVDTQGKLYKTGNALNKTCEQQLSDVIARGDLKGERGKTLLLHSGETNIQRILLVNIGEAKTLTAKQYRNILVTTIKAIKSYRVKHATSTLHEVNLIGRDIAWKIRALVLASHEAFYHFDQYKSNPCAVPQLQLINILADKKDLRVIKNSVKESSAIVAGLKLCKDLGNTPPNIANPTYLQKQAEQLAKAHRKVKVQHLEEAEMRKLGMNSFLSVSQGSDQPGKLIILEYKGSKTKKAPIVFVGKGITFDSGGYDLKTAAGMSDMKYDMCGAATILGLIQTLAEMDLAINVVGIIASAENMVNGKASRPSDIVTSMSGKTIEIMNTDAEGRLVLCDALTYAAKFNPEIVIDVATLTGGAIVALGFETATMFSNHQPLANALLKASEQADDAAWQLPMTDEGFELIKSNHADIANVHNYGDATAKAMQGACFLAHFTEEYKWAHLDIAGVAAKYGKNKHATGRPLQLLVQYLVSVAKRK